MKTIVRLLAVFALGLVTLGQHTPALAVDPPSGRSWFANASFDSIDPLGCVHTWVDVGFWSAVQDSGPSGTWSEIGISIYKYDSCTGTDLSYASGNAPLDDSEFQFSGNLNSASVQTTINVTDFLSESSFDVFVDLTWTGIGPLSRDAENSKLHTPICREMNKNRNTSREAQASGSVTDGETNFTGESSLFAGLSSSKGTFIFSCRVEMLALNQQIAAGGGLESYEYVGAIAEFYNTDSSGCVETWAGVSIVDFKQGPGTVSTASTAFVDVEILNRCPFTWLLRADGAVSLSDSDFKVSGNTAALNKTITINDDISGSSVDVLVNLTWQASGPHYQSLRNFQIHAPDCKAHFQQHWSWRVGKASGTVLSGDTNFAPGLLEYAEIFRNRLITDPCG